MKKIPPVYIFTDFDGTITIKDIGDEIFKEFGQFEPYHSQLKSGQLDIKDYWVAVCNTLKPGLKEQDIINYALKSEIDPWFTKFAEYCKNNNYPLFVVSDGFSSYIKPILMKLNLLYIPVISNYLTFEGNKIIPHYPLATESCNCLSASCKRNAILTQIPVDAIVVFIGDGYSDFCAAEHSDIIFAKNDLARFCVENKIPHYHYKSFFDVLRIFESVLPKKKLKHRNQAIQLRQKAYEIE